MPTRKLQDLIIETLNSKWKPNSWIFFCIAWLDSTNNLVNFLFWIRIKFKTQFCQIFTIKIFLHHFDHLNKPISTEQIWSSSSKIKRLNWLMREVLCIKCSFLLKCWQISFYWIRFFFHRKSRKSTILALWLTKWDMQI